MGEANNIFELLLEELVPESQRELLTFMAIHDEDSPVDLRIGEDKGKICFNESQVLAAAMAAIALAQGG
jgi:hypothetical protein